MMFPLAYDNRKTITRHGILLILTLTMTLRDFSLGKMFFAKLNGT